MPLTSSGAKCLTFDETFDNLVASSSRIFVTMPAKAAGSSLKVFTNKCVGFFGGHSWLPDYRFVYGGSQNTAKRTALRRLEQHAPTTGSGSYQISGVLATEFARS